ncbi:MAG: methylated-DNA--[protein]-cysteine S-methyltransferase [Dehalococcoidia bacterium]|nr:methylated-DNA--[protein]-cysteine S-methyltransferase [Dehalococcoidia bacterium]
MVIDRHYVTTIESQLGELTLVATDHGLRALKWPCESAGRLSLPEEMITCPAHPILESARLQLEEYFDGQRTEFDLPLDLRGTEFQQAAWRALASIPYGTTTSYGRQAARIGRPRAVRAIGAANGRNPISIILPCHRVIGAHGALTGYGGGIDIKRKLLAFELEISLGQSG